MTMKGKKPEKEKGNTEPEVTAAANANKDLAASPVFPSRVCATFLS